MKKFKKLTAAVLAAALTLSAAPMMTFADTMTDDGEMAKILVTQGANFILQRYKFDVTREQLYTDTLMKIMENHPELTEEAFQAMYSGLDQHSEYYTQDEYNYFLDSMSGEFSGIGVVITKINEGLLVTSVNDDSSAHTAGIRPDDIIIKADGEDITQMPFAKARSLIIGETGTFIRLGVMRGGEYMEFNVMRKPVVVEPGRYQILDDSIGYIRLDSFDGSAPELVNNALDLFDKANVTNIIFDLRSNPGGAVNALVEMSQRLIPAGPVIHFEYKDSRKNRTLYSECKNAKYKIIALVNENSASAAEALSGAIQDSGVGIVVGCQTYGKGTMQNLTDFKVGGGVRLTEAEYLTRNKRHINGKGIDPDVYVNEDLTTLKNSGFADLDFEKSYNTGDKSEVVLGINQRLYALGYDVGIPTSIYTDETHYAIYKVQEKLGITPTGICDSATQIKLEDSLQEEKFSDNASFNTALKIFKDKTIDKYIKEAQKKYAVKK